MELLSSLGIRMMNNVGNIMKDLPKLPIVHLGVIYDGGSALKKTPIFTIFIDRAHILSISMVITIIDTSFKHDIGYTGV